MFLKMVLLHAAKICQLFINLNLQTYYFPDLLTILHCDLYLLLVTIFKNITYYFWLLSHVLTMCRYRILYRTVYRYRIYVTYNVESYIKLTLYSTFLCNVNSRYL